MALQLLFLNFLARLLVLHAVPVSQGCEKCQSPDDCFHSQWAVPCSSAGTEVNCKQSGGEWCQAPSPAPASACDKCQIPDDCFHSSWAVPCSNAGTEANCKQSGGEWCQSPPPPAPSPSSACDKCQSPDDCFHSNWAVPCSNAGTEANCKQSGGQWCQAPPPAPASTCDKCQSPDDCFHSKWAVPCSNAGTEANCKQSGGEWCQSPPPPAPSPSSVCDKCQSPDDCFHSNWAVPCSNAGTEANCKQSGGQWCRAAPSGNLIKGNYVLSWAARNQVISNPSVSICFTGETNIDTVLKSWNCGVGSANYRALKGEKWLSVGGGNCPDASHPDNAWTITHIDNFITAVNSGKLSGYNGVVFDIEVDGKSCGIGGAPPSGSDFDRAYKAAKDKGLTVTATWSHSAPYKMANAVDITRTAIKSSNVDYVSPQMYGCGSLNKDTTSGVALTWSDYSSAQNKILPSIEAKGGEANANTQLADLKVWDASFAEVGVLAWPCQLYVANTTVLV